MSKENVIKFYELLKADKGAAEALKATLEAAKPADTDAAAGTLIAFARERGFEFSREDLDAAEAEAMRELSPEQLDQVNAAGNYCCFVGVGWGGKDHASYCYIAGIGYSFEGSIK